MKQKRTKKGQSLNLVLWFCFSLFAIVVVLIFAVVQIALLNRHFRKKAVDTLQTAGQELYQQITPTTSEQEAGKSIIEAYRDYGVYGYLIAPDGQSMLPNISSQKTYPGLAEALNKEFADDKSSGIFSYRKSLVYAIETTYAGQQCYICVLTPLESLSGLEEDMGLISFAMALVAIVLSLLASGIVATLITSPVNKVTQRATRLARGDYSLDFKEQYFCKEINELSEALDYARVEISKADKMQKELIANVSHDFKTPLTMIKAYASLIREMDGDKEKRDAHAKIIEDESDRLTALVSDLLDLSKIQAGFGADAKGVFNLSEEVYLVTSRFDFLKETASYDIATEIEDDLYVCANRARIQQVLYNLIGNAVNYTGEDKKVRVRLFQKGGNARFEVEDTGRGISKEEIPTIWDRYYRSSETHKRPVKGTGFGLSIVKGILEAHNCPYGVESVEGKGSIFWVEFPAPPEEEGDAAPKDEAKKPTKKKKEKKTHSGDRDEG